MNHAAKIEHYPETDPPAAQPHQQASAANLFELNTEKSHDESLSEAFYEEIDRWARRALAANGFGDY